MYKFGNIPEWVLQIDVNGDTLRELLSSLAVQNIKHADYIIRNHEDSGLPYFETFRATSGKRVIFLINTPYGQQMVTTCNQT